MNNTINKTNFLVAIVGRPNVGKSTLFNRITGKNRAILSDIPGTTRDILYEQVSWNRLMFSLADTAGLELDGKSDLEQDILLQTKVAVDAADLIIFLVDAHTGNQKEDLRAAKVIRKLNKPVILIVNKADSTKHDSAEHEFHNLGLGTPMLASAVSGRGVGDLLDIVVEKLLQLPPKTKKELATHDEEDREIIKVAIVGRPNVGKSTLINRLSGKKMAIVSNQPGTTRDTVISDIIIDDNYIMHLTDTAGLRRSGKIEKGIEKFSSLLVVKAVSDADIVLLLIDGAEGVMSQDLHIAQIALEAKVGIILVVNKWDSVQKSQTITHEFEKYLGQKFVFMPWAPRVYISALTGQRAQNIADTVKTVWQSLTTKIPTKELNNLIIDSVASLPPKGKRKPPKIYFSHQVSNNPPTIELKVNFPEELHYSYVRYLDKKIRAKYPLPGSPINWKLTKSSNKTVV